MTDISNFTFIVLHSIKNMVYSNVTSLIIILDSFLKRCVIILKQIDKFPLSYTKTMLVFKQCSIEYLNCLKNKELKNKVIKHHQ